MNWIKSRWADFVFVVILGTLAGLWLLQPGYFNMHDDLQMMRQLEMEKCFLDGQIPCRWVPDMGYGFGFPLFNYYPPLPYLVGQGIRVLGFSFVDTAKYTFFLSIVLSGIAMYLLSRAFWGRLGGVVSAAFYIWAPYHALDVYVRGAMNEAWAFVFFPLILWSSYKLICEARFRWIVILALSWFGLFTSHNLMVLIFAPFFALWLLLWLWRERSWFTLLQLAASGVWAFGLAAFFVIPVLLEKNLVHVETLVVGYYNYIVHFVSLNQLLFSRFWGHGASVWGIEDQMSFQIGHLHWILSLVIAAIVVLSCFRKKVQLKKLLENRLLLAGAFFFAIGWWAAFMAHSRSTPIWQAIDPMKFIQFSWRFLIIVTLAFSVLAGAIVPLSRRARRLKKLPLVVALVLSVGVVFFNKDYFKPEHMGPLTDEEKFSGLAWDKLQTAGIYDYLPKTAKTAAKGPQETVGEVVEGEAEIFEASQGTRWAEMKVEVQSESAIVRFNILEFPNWRVFAGGKEIETFVGEDELGRIHFNFPQGEHIVRAEFHNTPPRMAGNLISAFSWLALVTVPLWRRR